MKLGFVSSARRGQHFDLAEYSIKKLKTVNLNMKGHSERNFESSIVSYLQASRRLRINLITQIGEDEVEKINRAVLFGFKHRPDISIGNDGTAIEIKVVSRAPSIRDILGQALAYRIHYRFVILVLVDQTPNGQIVELCRKKESTEYKFLSGLANMFNIFSVVGPAASSKNIIFRASRTDISAESKAEPSVTNSASAVFVKNEDESLPKAA